MTTPPLPAEYLDDLRRHLASVPDPTSLLEEIFASAPVGLQIYDSSGHCLVVNRAFRELFGSVPPPEYCVFDDSLAAEHGLTGQMRRAFAGERVKLPLIWYDSRELKNVTVSEGRRVAMSAEIVPLRAADGSVPRVLFVFNDLTAELEAREQAEAARDRAQDSAARSDFLAEAGRVLSSSLEYEVTLARIARLATPTLADFCIVDLVAEGGGLRRVAAVHADPERQPLIDELCLRFPPDTSSRQPAARVLATGRPELLEVVDPEVIRSHASSPEHVALMEKIGVRSHLAVPMLGGDGRTLGAISFGYASDRRYRPADVPLAEALATRASLAIENAQLYREAQVARGEAEAANRAKDQFLALLGHELRNPLAPMVTALELLTLRDGPSRERTIIEQQVTHLGRLVDDLLDVSRIARANITLARETMELRRAVLAAVEMAMPLIEQRRHQLSVDVPAHGLTVYGDPVRLAQVVANLLTNAAKYTDPGGRIEIRAAREGDAVVVRVRDNGMGIPAELLPTVFDLFVQGPRTIDRADGGLGLGLTVVKGLVELHGGHVMATSAGTGQGSELAVTLPAASGPSADLGRTQPPAVGPAGRRVLLVDDNIHAVDLMAEMLREHGYETLVAYAPLEAIAAARRFQPDIAILDIGLPDMDGYELAGRLRALASPRSLRLVAVTGYGRPADEQRARAAGFDCHLVKPARFDSVLAALVA